MAKFIVEMWLDGYEKKEDMDTACMEFIQEELNMASSGVTVTQMPEEKPVVVDDDAEDSPYWNIEGVIADIEYGVANDVGIKTLRRIQEQMNNLQRNYAQLATALGADLDAATHEDCIEVALALNRIKTAIVHSRPEETGALFITGMSGRKDKLGLPEFISVCPTYGLDSFQTYKKHGKYT